MVGPTEARRMITPWVDRWKRRAWQPDTVALAALPRTRPAIVITGGSEGIGQALASAFSDRGKPLVLVARNPAKLEQAANHLNQAAAKPACLTLSQDLTAPDATDNLRAFLASHGLHAEILISSAGIGNSGDFAAETPEKLEALCQLNVTALTRLTRALLPDMLTRGSGGIINVASLGGFAPGPYQSAYYASKAYVISLTRALEHETRGAGVRIACLAPGPVNTGFHERAGPGAESAFYRRILPAMSPVDVAQSAHRGYDLGHGLIIPGLFAHGLGMIMRLTPSALQTPIIAILLKPRTGRKSS